MTFSLERQADVEDMDMQARATFLARALSKQETSDCFPDGFLDLSLTETCHIEARPVHQEDDPCLFATRGCAALSLQLPQKDQDDMNIRRAVYKFLQEGKSWSCLQAKFPTSRMDCSFPTHVTRRRAPPDQMSLVHIDYPLDHGLKELLDKWKERWKLLDGWRTDFVDRFDLMGIVTVWICLSPKVLHNPLWVAHANVPFHLKRIYAVKGKRHSVGVLFDSNTQWYCQPDMKRGDVWLFDTQRSPHVAADLGPSPHVRESAECRVLVLQTKQMMESCTV